MKINVTVKPGSKVEKIIQEGDTLTLYTHAQAHDGEANEAVVKILARYFSISKGCITIVSGGKSKRKIVEIIGVE